MDSHPPTKAYRSKELIEEIRKRPRLWRPAYKNCADKETRSEHWVGVAKALFPSFDAMITEVKKRWKNIRDHYIKETKRRRKGAKCIYRDTLKFLDQLPAISKLSASPVSQTTDQQAFSQPLNQPSTGINLVKVEEESDYGGGDPVDEQLPQEGNEAFTTDIPDFGTHANSYLCDEEEHIDEDKSFLLSLLPEMRKLSGLQKLDFKIAVLNDLRTARYSVNHRVGD